MNAVIDDMVYALAVNIAVQQGALSITNGGVDIPADFDIEPYLAQVMGDRV